MTKKSTRRVMPNTMSITELSQNASGAVARAIELGETGEPLVLLRHNKPVAVLLEFDVYQEMLDAQNEQITEEVVRMFERDRGVKREDLPAYLEAMRADRSGNMRFEEFLANFEATRDNSDASA